MPVVIQVDRNTLTEIERNGLDILAHLPSDSVHEIKDILRLGMPDIIGTQTLKAFVELCTDHGLNLSTKGVNAFKDEHELGNTGDFHGKIGPQTADVYLQSLMVLLDRESQCCFPFAKLPNVGWTGGPRGFASNRNRGQRAHAGCDLYFPVGTTMHAITDGVVTEGPYAFYLETFALEVDHGDFLARYGEVQKSTMVKKGDRIKRGQPIAKVGKLKGLNVTMLHLELYDKSASGQLTVIGAGSKKRADGVPFMRRKDLIDPTPLLNDWKDNLPTEG